MKNVFNKVMCLVLGLVLSITSIVTSPAQAATVKINKKKVEMCKGNSVRLKVNTKKNVKWSSSNKKVAKVSKKGNVKAVGYGNATIKATVGKKVYKCKVMVDEHNYSGTSCTVDNQCSRCGDIYEKATGHIGKEGATCEDGAYCEVCGKWAPDSIKVTHNYQLVESEYDYPDGYSSFDSICYQCEDCLAIKLDRKIDENGNKIPNVEERQQIVKERVDEIIASEGFDLLSSDVEKVEAVYEYIVLNACYDWENYKKSTVPKVSYEAYGIMIEGIGVCAGYARAFSQFMNKLGIECKVITSKAMDHAWNLVKIDGVWYHVDITWGDAGNYADYAYCLVDDNTMRQLEHNWTASEYPVK